MIKNGYKNLFFDFVFFDFVLFPWK